MKSKEGRIREAIIEFRDSRQLVSNYINLFVVVRDVTAQGGGLLWIDITEILRDEVPTI